MFSTLRSHLKRKRDILWAPWRMEYIACTEKPCGCIFCVKPRENEDRKNLILHRGKNVFVILNRYPYNNGHVMVVPYRHVAELSQLSESEQVELLGCIVLSQAAIQKTMSPQGFNIGMNLGRVAGAGVENHLHFHLVPRWNGDTNFMPITGYTKVVSEGLESAWEKLMKTFQEIQ